MFKMTPQISLSSLLHRCSYSTTAVHDIQYYRYCTKTLFQHLLYITYIARNYGGGVIIDNREQLLSSFLYYNGKLLSCCVRRECLPEVLRASGLASHPGSIYSGYHRRRQGITLQGLTRQAQHTAHRCVCRAKDIHEQEYENVDSNKSAAAAFVSSFHRSYCSSMPPPSLLLSYAHTPARWD